MVKGGATRGGVTGGVTHAMSGGGRCSSGGEWGHTGWCHRMYDTCHVRGGAAVEEGGATWGGVTGGVTHHCHVRWRRVGPHGVV